MIDVGAIAQAMEEARRNQGFVSIKGYKSQESVEENEYCLFLKPELTGLKDRFPAVAEIVFERLCAFYQRVVAATVMEASYIARHHLMEQHYGVINAISREGVSAMGQTGRQKLSELFRNDLATGLEVLGAHQFLERYTYFTAQALAVFYDNLGNIKLAPGTHGVRAVVRGSPVLVLNGFHPEQLERYTRPGSVIVAFTLRTTLSWRDLRTKMTGVTNPAKALPESIRGTLFALKQKLGLPEVSSGTNGVHVSAGPVEGMAEICRYMSDLNKGQLVTPPNTSFGKLLAQVTGRSDLVSYFATNPNVDVDGKNISVFVLTEELDAKEACNRVQSLASLNRASGHV